MNSSANFRPATSHVGPDTGALFAIDEDPNWRPPVDPQKARAFCILRLRGCQTLWADSEHEAAEIIQRLTGPSLLFRYHEVMGQYVPESPVAANV